MFRLAVGQSHRRAPGILFAVLKLAQTRCGWFTNNDPSAPIHFAMTAAGRHTYLPADSPRRGPAATVALIQAPSGWLLRGGAASRWRRAEASVSGRLPADLPGSGGAALAAAWIPRGAWRRNSEPFRPAMASIPAQRTTTGAAPQARGQRGAALRSGLEPGAEIGIAAG